MKSLLFTIVILIVSVVNLFPQKMGNAYALNINNIYLPMTNTGVLAEVYVPPIGLGGQFGGHTFLFSGGFFLSGLKDGEPWTNAVASSSLVIDYLPGTYAASSDPRAQIYRVRSDDSAFGASWQDWRDAVSLGADFYDGDGNGMYYPYDYNGNGQWDPDEDRPDIIGDEMLWCAYYDGVPAAQRRWNTVSPKGIEIRQSVFAFSDLPAVENIIFIRYRIKYIGLSPSDPEYLDSVYFGIWDDPDLGESSDDRVGCDTLLQGGYVYNNGADPIYGNSPPSFFAASVEGPAVYIPGETFIDNNGNGYYDPGEPALDTAYTNRGPILGIEVYPGAKNQLLSSSVNFLNGDPNLSDPDNEEQARNFILGLSRTGEVVDPCTWPYGDVMGGIDCSEVNPVFWYSGDVVTNTGWINTFEGDQRQLQNIGPFRLFKGETFEVFTAYAVGRNTNSVTSIVAAKDLASIAHLLYNSNFDTSAVTSIGDMQGGNTPEGFSLYQNFPNPFNPATIIKYTVPHSSKITIKVFDVLGKEIETLVDKEKSAGTYKVTWNAADLPSGVYFYRIQAGEFVQTKKMILLK